MTVKSQDDLNQPETHSTEVLLEVISKLETTTKEKELYKEIIKDEMIKNGEMLEEIERLQKQLKIAVKALDSLRGICFPQRAEKALEQIKELDK